MNQIFADEFIDFDFSAWLANIACNGDGCEEFDFHDCLNEGIEERGEIITALRLDYAGLLPM